MDIVEAVTIGAAGIAAGAINAVVGSGTLITFPALLAFGYPPVLANVSNNIGLVPGVFSATHGYRRELRGQMPRLARLGAASFIGALTGAWLLLSLPSQLFHAIAPALILIACLLVMLQPRLNQWLKRRQAHAAKGNATPMWFGVLGAGVYGGYFGAAQGVLLMGLLGSFLPDDLQRLNAVKNALASIVNGVAAAIFIEFTHVGWEAAGLIAAGSAIGGTIGARIGRKLPPNVFRGVIIAIGVTAASILIAQ